MLNGSTHNMTGTSRQRRQQQKVEMKKKNIKRLSSPKKRGNTIWQPLARRECEIRNGIITLFLF